MKKPLIILILLTSPAIAVSCGKDRSRNAAAPARNDNAASPRKEITAQNVLAVQLASHGDVESRTTFAPGEPIPSSIYLSSSSRVEPRRISALLVRDDQIFEEQSTATNAGETRNEFDFRFVKTPRPPGSYQIKFVEIARSHGRPVPLARLFLIVE